MTEQDKRIAVIGYGYWGEKLVQKFFELGALHLVCDRNENRLKAASKSCPSVKTTSAYEEILNNEDVNAVVISTPTTTHYQLVKESILSGKDVFVEKPLSVTVDEAIELTSLADQRKKILMVGHLLEYHPAILRLKELIDRGDIGKINYIYSNRLNLGKIRREENILWSFAPHDISVMLLLLNEMPTLVYAQGGNYLHKDIADVTVSNLEFGSGTKGHIFVSWLHPYKEQKLIVVGDKRMVLFDDVEKHNKLLLYNYRIDWTEGIPTSTSQPAEVVGFDGLEPLKEECKHFLQCLITRQKPKTDGQNGVRVLKVLQACQRSLERNEVVAI